jgi:hypothetical protein
MSIVVFATMSVSMIVRVVMVVMATRTMIVLDRFVFMFMRATGAVLMLM